MSEPYAGIVVHILEPVRDKPLVTVRVMMYLSDDLNEVLTLETHVQDSDSREQVEEAAKEKALTFLWRWQQAHSE